MATITSPILDFTVLNTHNPGTIGIADTSFYPSGFAIINPTLEIAPPSFNKATLPYNTGNLKIFNTNNLNITCVTDPCLLGELPDGIWTVNISVNPIDKYFKTKTFIRTTSLERKFGLLFLKTDITQCNADIKDQQMRLIDEIWYYIQGAVAAANDCNNYLAMQLYGYANRMTSDALENKSNFYMNPGYYLYGN